MLSAREIRIKRLKCIWHFWKIHQIIIYQNLIEKFDLLREMKTPERVIWEILIL